jgi:tRNA A-37 threonylcarbamoyl transferase component Bud32
VNEETLFHLAREKSPEDQQAFLDAACAGNPLLRQRVEVLLQADKAADSFLARPAAEGLSPLSAQSAAATLAPDEAMSTMSSASRVRYFGDYELLEEIAQGGMGVVWKARQSNLHRDVALKMIRAGTLATAAEVARFNREAEAAANLQHPNIVAIHEVGEHAGRHYFSMDLVNGHDLGAIVAEGPLALQRAARYVKIIAEAIHFAHQRGTLHRDLKPQNILIDAADQPRITDFGLAKTTSDSQLTQSGVIMGSPSYMPPEQAAGRLGEIGPASDVYSLGAMLYELLTGRPPFRGDTAMATLRDVMETEPPALRKLKADVPPDLETICLKCLEKSPAARYPTAQALADELARFLKGEPIQARPASAIRKTVSWCRRHPGTLAALAALAIVTLACGVFYLLEENAFLRAKLANPSLERVRGLLHEVVVDVMSVINIMVLGGFILTVVLSRRAMGLPVSGDIWTAKLNARPQQPLGSRARNVGLASSLILLGSGAALLAVTIRAHVWEGEPIWSAIGSVYFSIWIGLGTMRLVVRDYRLVHYGTPVAPIPGLPPMTEEQATAFRGAEEKARAALQTWDQQAALKAYREALPGFKKRDAYWFVVKLQTELRAEEPEKYAYPPLSLENISWRGIVICALIETAVLGYVLWYNHPLSNPGSTVLFFTYGFLFGVATLIVTRVKSLLATALLLAPPVFTVIVSQAVLQAPGWQWRIAASVILGMGVLAFAHVKRPWLKPLFMALAFFFVIICEAVWQSEGTVPTLWLYFGGYVFGALLMACGLAGEAGRALRKKLSRSSGESSRERRNPVSSCP